MAMNTTAIFWMQILLSLGIYTLVALWYVWPSLTRRSRNSVLIPLLFVHVMRYSGLTTLIPGMIDPRLPRDFLATAAYGDLLAAALALATIFALRGKWRVAVPLAWVFSTWGIVDMLNGLRSTFGLNVVSFNLDTFWYVYVFYAPLVIVTHVMVIVILAKSRSWKK
jgi:hypothetical protein